MPESRFPRSVLDAWCAAPRGVEHDLVRISSFVAVPFDRAECVELGNGNETECDTVEPVGVLNPLAPTCIPAA